MFFASRSSLAAAMAVFMPPVLPRPPKANQGLRLSAFEPCASFISHPRRSRNAVVSSSSASSGDADDGRCHGGGAESPEEEPVWIDAPVPEYHEHAVAREVFADLHFYGGNARARDHLASQRATLGRTTVGELRRKCYRAGRRVEDVLYRTYGVLSSHDYFSFGDAAALQQREYVALNAHRELQAFRDFMRRPRRRDGFRPRLPAMWDAYRCGSDEPHCYTDPDCYVLGPHGSGKTFFALDFLKDFLNGGEQNVNDERILPGVVLYLHPAEIVNLTCSRAGDGYASKYARELADWIRRGLEEELQRRLSARLPMHVCVVLDNAGDPRLGGVLLNRFATRAIRERIEATVAERVVLVVAGTGLITDEIQEGRGGAYHFRMKPLQREDLYQMLCNRFYDAATPFYRIKEGGIPAKDPHKEALAIAGAIEAQPSLMAAARNTQMALGLVEAIVATVLKQEARCEGRHLAEYWSAQLGASAAGLLRIALHGYVESSTMLATLDLAQRRRLAFWTLWALDAMNEEVGVTIWPSYFRYPEFPGLSDREREVAMAMVEINTVRYRGGFGKLRWETHVATIVPANLLVMFYLLGVPTSVLSGWATNDVGTALYAVLQWVVKKVQNHHDEILRPLQKSCCPEFDFDSKDATLTAFESQLARKGDDAVSEYRSRVQKHEESLERSLREVPLRLLPPWELQAEGGCIRLPRATRDSILVCGGDLPDVVAPYVFLRAVRVHRGVESVDLESELRRCCLLRDCEDDRLFRWFHALWSGALDDKLPDDGRNDEFLIDPKGRMTGNKKLRLPQVVPECGNDSIRFVLSTCAEKIRVALPNGQVLQVEGKMLDSDKQLNLERATFLRWLDSDTAVAWTTFIHEKVVPRVKVQFLFVKSGISPLDATSTRQTCYE